MKKSSIGSKMYIFALATVLFTAAAVCALSYFINANQVDNYYKQLTVNSANAYSYYVDVDFMKELREVAESDEYQAIREAAEEAEDEEPVIEYLKEKGLWEKYESEREEMRTYVSNMKDIEYLYLVVMGDNDGGKDMYLLDADDVEVYETGYFEEREAAFEGYDMQGVVPPVISEGDWGWLCSGYIPIYDKAGKLVCHVGCDISMDEVRHQRKIKLAYLVISALVCMVLFFAVASIFVRRSIVNPLKVLTREMKKFSPKENSNYEEAGVLDIKNIKSAEIEEIYEETRSMQIRIVDYINSITEIKRDKERAEFDAKSKEQVIDKISVEAFKDALTGIGNKNAYTRKEKELNRMIRNENLKFAVVMIDVNGLKKINDNHGHSQGDIYLKGCCHHICEVFKHSPVFRVGGDEFVAILYGEDYKDRDEKVEELRKIYAESYSNEEVSPWLRYSASIGIAVNDQPQDNVETVFKRADEAMYKEKAEFKKEHAGR